MWWRMAYVVENGGVSPNSNFFLIFYPSDFHGMGVGSTTGAYQSFNEAP